MSTHVLPPHCDDPGCLVAVLYAKCTVCGFRVYSGGECPAVADEEPIRFAPDPTDPHVMRQVSGPRLSSSETTYAPGFNPKARF